MSAADNTRTRLRDIMLRRYLRLGESHTLHEVMGFLTNKHFEESGIPFLVVIAEDGSFAGMLRPKAVFSALMEGVNPGENEEKSLMKAAPVNLRKTTGHIMDRNIPTLAPDSTLEDAFRSIRASGSEVVAVLEEGRVIGLVTARLLFEKASLLTVGALTGGVIPPA
ncbi:MAG: CBS domain-containing protein [Puniceicoccaceae bacterium]